MYFNEYIANLINNIETIEIIFKEGTEELIQKLTRRFTIEETTEGSIGILIKRLIEQKRFLELLKFGFMILVW